MEHSMKNKSLIVSLTLLMDVLCLFFPVRTYAQNPKGIPGLTVSDKTVVRFLFSRLNANYVLPPVIFRVADAGSPNWNTAPVDEYGRAPYISLSEMRSLVRKLEDSNLRWQVASPASPIEPFETIAPNKNLFITVYDSNEMAITRISPSMFCEILSQVNETIELKRAHWEFEYFRRGCGCKVPGYRADEYPNDR
jgi:hypothetical protein